MSDKYVLPEKYFLEKAATMKRFEYSPLCKELKAETDIAKKQCQKLDDTFEFDNKLKNNQIIKKEKPTLKKYNKSNLIYDSKYSFLKYFCDIKEFDNLYFQPLYSFLISFLKFNKVKPQKEEKKEKKTNASDAASE